MMDHDSFLSIAVVGTNFISDWFCDAAFEVDGVKVVAVFSRAPDTGAAFAAKHSIPMVYTDYEKMLADPKIDAVYIASPIFCHEAQAIGALRAKKQVLCEKMIATDLAAFLRMKEEAERQGCVLLEAMRPQYDPALSVLKNSLAKIGRIRRASLEFDQYSSRYDAFRAGTVMNAFNPDLQNSALADIGIYPLHLCIELFGAPERVTGESTFLSNGFEGAGCMLLSYPDFSATVRYSKISQSVLPSVIEGEEGSLTLDKTGSPEKLLFYPRIGVPEEIALPPLPALTRALPQTGVFHTVSYANMTYEIAAFRDCVLGKRDSREYLAVTEAAMRTVERFRNR